MILRFIIFGNKNTRAEVWRKRSRWLCKCNTNKKDCQNNMAMLKTIMQNYEYNNRWSLQKPGF